MPRRPVRATALPEAIAASLRERIGAEWSTGDQLPTEAELAAEYGVSRHTMRSSLLQLARAGLVETRHGSGTYVTRYNSSIRAGLQELRSLHDVIASQGHRPGSSYRLRQRRPASADEAGRLEREPGADVFEIEREITSDDRTVAFDYSVIAADVVDLEVSDLSGSIFERFASVNALPERAVCQVRAVLDPDAGWGAGRSGSGLYLLLDQVQYLPGGRPLSWSRIYFLDDGFDFLLVRHGH
ncbi:GntR family transcriptional regulator [Cryptosporangium phraense]|uniref:GntR family transcriptional regulator n=1 Tax=Cryptosporangium phraense TaxID=2593070 RepID=A0A545AH55_9ACTN|nr:GntR family transcriptional regulator [Cryptosporangium phraense]TQS40653.1 GntR family transcriptional regulator [Cryptosporangium phraense]